MAKFNPYSVWWKNNIVPWQNWKQKEIRSLPPWASDEVGEIKLTQEKKSQSKCRRMQQGLWCILLPKGELTEDLRTLERNDRQAQQPDLTGGGQMDKRRLVSTLWWGELQEGVCRKKWGECVGDCAEKQTLGDWFSIWRPNSKTQNAPTRSLCRKYIYKIMVLSEASF